LDIFCRPWLDITKCKWSFLHQPLHFVSMHGWANLYTISKKYIYIRGSFKIVARFVQKCTTR
jgi:hypothetical protein